MANSLIISKGTEFLKVPVDALVCIIAEGNYSSVLTQDGHESLVSFQLGQVEALLFQQLQSSAAQFVRIGRGLIVNVEYINFIDISKQVLIVSDCKSLRKEVSASRDALIKLKDYMEQMINNKENG